MDQTPRVSIVTPLYNSEAFLRQTIESVLAQSFQAWELVLIDDGSTDRTWELAEELAAGDRRIRLIAGEHAGVAAARNSGFAATDIRSEYICFLDHDDVWELDALGILVATLDICPANPGAHGLARSIDLEGKPFENDDLPVRMLERRAVQGRSIVELPVESPTTFNALLIQNCLVTPGTSLMRRTTFFSQGGFAPSTVPADDWDLALRISRKGDFVFVNRVVIQWRRHPGAASYNTRKWRQADLAVWKRIISSEENTLEQRQAAEFALARICGENWSHARRSILRGRLREATHALARAVLYYRIHLKAVLFKK